MKQKSPNELADLATEFADLDERRFMHKVADRQGSGMGSKLAGRLAGIPYDRLPSPWLCDRLQWVIENTPYELVPIIEPRAAGWFVGYKLILQETGQEIEGAGQPPIVWEGGVQDMSNLPKQMMVMGLRSADNVIRYMIDRGLTNGS